MLLDLSPALPAALLVALVADALLGEPRWLYRRLPHPVVAIGWAIAWLERRLLRPGLSAGRLRAHGLSATLVLAAGALLLGGAVRWLAFQLPGGWLVEGLLMGTLLAQRSLVEHVGAVADGMERHLSLGRAAVARIVGRDPHRLDAGGVGRAAVESLAENLSDGVMAPLFWGAVAGLPGMLAYKAINTADSMIGHRSERYRDFGWASARLDDLVNLVPARLTGALLCLAGWLRRGVSPLRTWRAMRRDAPRHRSPNAGWPEAAMAAALGLRLAGPRAYGGAVVDDGWMGDGRAEVNAHDIRRAIDLAWTCWALATTLVAVWLVAALLG